MSEDPSNMRFVMMFISLLVILAIFAMKYGAQYFRDRSLAAKKTETDARISTLDEKSRNLEKRVTHIEALLKEVE